MIVLARSLKLKVSNDCTGKRSLAVTLIFSAQATRAIIGLHGFQQVMVSVITTPHTRTFSPPLSHFLIQFIFFPHVLSGAL
jgi:hypothetical protein